MTIGTLATFEELEQRIAMWVERQPDVRAALILGSRARTSTPADAYSDLDVLLLATDPDRYLSTTDWLAALGVPRITFIEETATGGGKERRVLFEGGLDVDFAIFPAEMSERLVQLLEPVNASMPEGENDEQAQEVAHALELASAFRDTARRGARILVDKDGVLARLLALLDRLPVPPLPKPTEHDFLETVSDFWYHALWTARKLRRGELWVAKSCCDSYLKALVLRMLAWHARATHGWDYETWHGGRFLEEWADPRALVALRAAFAHYDAEDVSRALRATMDLFRQVATEVAAALHSPYPADGDQYISNLVSTLLSAQETEQE